MVMLDEDAVKVHIIQDDTKAALTEEIEPEHFTTTSYILPATGLTSGDQADYNAENPAQILQLDPLRKECVISVNGTGQVLLAHSQAQAISLQQGTSQTADQGCLLTSPTSIRVEGTGPLWAVQFNAGNPTPTSPAVPASGVAQQNLNGYPVQVVISPNGATITNVSVNGVTVGTAAGTYVVPAYGSISIAYTVATPTWVWTNLNASGVLTVGVVQERRGM